MLKLQAPGSPKYTAVILILFAGLLIYGFVKGDPIVFAILAILLVFFGLPLLLLYILNRRSLRTAAPHHNGDLPGADLSLLDTSDPRDGNN